MRRAIALVIVVSLCISLVLGITSVSMAYETGGEGAAQCDVFFYGLEGEELLHTQAPEGEPLADPALALQIPDGARFAGWFAQGAAEAYRFGEEPVTGELKLYAALEPQAERPVSAGNVEQAADEPQQKAAEEEPVAAQDADAQLCEVTYMVDGGIYKTEQVEKDTLPDLTAPSVPHDLPFLGWYANGEDAPFREGRLVTGDITLTAKFSEDLLVTYLDTDGSVLEVFEVKSGALAPEPTKEVADVMGYKFDYWTVEENGVYVKYNDDAPVTENITLKPKLSEIALAVFITNGSEVEPQTGPDGFKVSEPAAPTRMGFSFDGWYEDQAGNTAFDFTTKEIHGTVFIYAKWIPAKVDYVLNFWVENPNVAAGDPRVAANRKDYSIAYTKGMQDYADKEVTFTAAQAKAQWPTLAADESAFTLLTYSTYEYSDTAKLSNTGTTIINVYYKRTRFELVFDVNNLLSGGQGTTPGVAFSGAEIMVNGVSKGTRYTIEITLGQDVSNLWPSAVKLPNSAAGKTQYHYTWGGYYSNGAKTVPASTLAVAFSAPYALRGATNGSGFVYDIKDPVRWSVNLYMTITDNPTTLVSRCYYIEISEKEYNELKAEGTTQVRAYEAVGAPNYTGLRYYKLAFAGPYNVQGSVSSATSWPGTQIDGYEQVLAAGTKNAACTAQYFQKTFQDKDKGANYYHLEYYMPRKVFTLTLVMNQGEIGDPQHKFTQAGDSYTIKVPYDEPIDDILALTGDATRQFHTFEGWWKDSECNGESYVAGSRMPVGNVTLYAKFEGIAVSVTYNDGVKDIKTNGYDLGEPLVVHDLSGTPMAGIAKGTEIAGKGIFQGWFYRFGKTQKVETEFPLGMQLTEKSYVLTAKYTPRTYYISFMLDPLADGEYSLYATLDVKSGSTNTLAKSGHRTPAANLDGFTLKGWSTTEGSAAADFTAATEVTGDMTVYSVWSRNNYNVTYKEGTPAGAANMPSPAVQPKAYQSAVTVEAAPTLQRYQFQGWLSGYDGKTYDSTDAAANTFVMPAQGVTLTAQWKADAYTVTFDKNGGDQDASPLTKTATAPTFTVGALPAAPARAGYTFAGWNTAADGKGAGFTAATGVYGDIRVYAQWTPVSYQLSFDLNGATGSAPKPQALHYGSTASTVADPVWSGHTFRGWNTAKDGSGSGWDFASSSMPAGDVVLYAQWSTDPVPDPDPEPSPSASPSAAPTAKPSPSASPSASASVTPAPVATPAPAPDETASGGGAAAGAVAASTPPDGGDGGGAVISIGTPETQPKGFQVGDGGIPLSGAGLEIDTWALLNLLLMIAGVGVAAVGVVAAIARKRGQDKAETRKPVRPVWVVIGVILGMAGMVAFLLTEDTANMMVWIDGWTPLMAALMAGAGIAAALAFRKASKSGAEGESPAGIRKIKA